MKSFQQFKLVISDGKDQSTTIDVNVSRLARITGYNKSHISRVFSQKTNPSVRCLEEVSKALGIGIQDLHNAIKGGKINVQSRK